jgi:hypothetical protein
MAQDENWYEAAAATLTVKHPPNVVVSSHSEVIATWSNMTLPGGTVWRLAGREIAYVIAVTNEGKKPVAGISLQVVDTRLPVLPVSVVGTLGTEARVVPDGFPLPDDPDSSNPQSLFWLLPSIDARETQILRYQVRSDYSIRVTPGEATIDEANNLIRLSPTSPNGAELSFSIDVMNRNQVVPLYDAAEQQLLPSWSEITRDNQVFQRATFQSEGIVQIEWNGRWFKPGS